MRRPTTIRGTGKRNLWPHAVDARPEFIRDLGLPLAEDMRPICTECRGRIEDGMAHLAVVERPGFFRHDRCPGNRCVNEGVTRIPVGPGMAASVPDEELERERARLVGKRATWEPDGILWTIARMERGGPYPPITVYGESDDGAQIAHALGSLVLVDERPRETTFGELAVGEWFTFEGLENVRRKTGRDVWWNQTEGDTWSLHETGRLSTDPVIRIDPPA